MKPIFSLILTLRESQRLLMSDFRTEVFIVFPFFGRLIKIYKGELTTVQLEQIMNRLVVEC